jgi:hypothetical protein
MFPITARIPMGRNAEGKLLRAVDADRIARERLQESRRSVCSTCDWLAAGRCARPCPICPRDERRKDPWANLPRCPDNRWL